jgi:hypothetical protein
MLQPSNRLHVECILAPYMWSGTVEITIQIFTKGRILSTYPLIGSYYHLKEYLLSRNWVSSVGFIISAVGRK